MKKITTRTKINKRWQEKNKDYSNYLKHRSSARGFIRNKATEEDLKELEQLIKERREVLNVEIK